MSTTRLPYASAEKVKASQAARGEIPAAQFEH